MSYTNSTPNYNLPQFEPTDKPAWLTDVNSAYSTIDSAIKQAKDSADAKAPNTIFTGTDGVNTGTQGLVPAPLVANVDQFLKSDGTWATPSSGSGGLEFKTLPASWNHNIGDLEPGIYLIYYSNVASFYSFDVPANEWNYNDLQKGLFITYSEDPFDPSMSGGHHVTNLHQVSQNNRIVFTITVFNEQFSATNTYGTVGKAVPFEIRVSSDTSNLTFNGMKLFKGVAAKSNDGSGTVDNTFAYCENIPFTPDLTQTVQGWFIGLQVSKQRPEYGNSIIDWSTSGAFTPTGQISKQFNFWDPIHPEKTPKENWADSFTGCILPGEGVAKNLFETAYEYSLTTPGTSQNPSTVIAQFFNSLASRRFDSIPFVIVDSDEWYMGAKVIDIHKDGTYNPDRRYIITAFGYSLTEQKYCVYKFEIDVGYTTGRYWVTSLVVGNAKL